MAAHTTAILSENLHRHARAPNRNLRYSHEVYAHSARHRIVSHTQRGALVSGGCRHRLQCVPLIAVCNRMFTAVGAVAKLICVGIEQPFSGKPA